MKMADETLHTEYLMNEEKTRAATFCDWPLDNENCQCTSKKMAEAGFYHIPSDKEPDLVRCFCCLKELDGWEPQDDPWKEHKKHSPKCCFVKMNKREDELKIEDIIKIEIERQKARIDKSCREKIEAFREHAEKVREYMENI